MTTTILLLLYYIILYYTILYHYSIMLLLFVRCIKSPMSSIEGLLGCVLGLGLESSVAT